MSEQLDAPQLVRVRSPVANHGAGKAPVPDEPTSGSLVGRRKQRSRHPMKTSTSPKPSAAGQAPVAPVSFAIGSIVSYAGDLSVPDNLAKLVAEGWLLCDGTSYARTKYPGLSTALRSAHGGDDNNFNVPDLRDRFIRGVNHDAVQPNGTTVDPDIASRTAVATGGATMNNVGSVQAGATGLPVSPLKVGTSGTHAHTITHTTSAMDEVWDGNTYRMARWSGNATTDQDGAHSHTLSGYDAATSPVWFSLYFIIRCSLPATPAGVTPAGAIAAFGGASGTAPDGWLACDGAAYSMSQYPNLVNMLGNNYGGDGVHVLNVPDFRGNFLRATNHGLANDPDAAKRYAANTGGNSGDRIGSAQGWATLLAPAMAIVQGGAHAHNIGGVPQRDHHAAYGAIGTDAYNVMQWTDDATTSTQDGDHSHRIVGGDKETRPSNVYLDWLIAADDVATDAPPIGSILPIGTDTTDFTVLTTLIAKGWLPVNGNSLRISDATYAALYQVIGKQYGGTSLKFDLPDVRGLFVAGAGSSRALGAQAARSMTGAPVTPMTTSTDGLHSHSFGDIRTDTRQIDVVSPGYDLAENNDAATPTSTDGQHTHTLSGGDAESRPVNVYVDYIIRFK